MCDAGKASDGGKMRCLPAALVACLSLAGCAASVAQAPEAASGPAQAAAPPTPPMRVPPMVSLHPPPPVTPASADDPLAGYYGNTLISEKLSNISSYGGAAHV